MTTLSKNILYYGQDEPLPAEIELRAGPLSMIYTEGDLRYIKLGRKEILRRVYVAIRDHNWDTILPELSNLDLDIREDSFRLSYEVENKQDGIDFVWQGTISGEPDGTITFRMDGQARSTFRRNRIGFCVLHPANCAGVACGVEHVDGRVSKSNFPEHISPHQPFFDMQAIRHQVTPQIWAEVRFEGETFEMEDQRNWTDASYKTYCTPLSLPFPVEVPAGAKISQTITLNLAAETDASWPEAAGNPRLALTLHRSASTTPIPQLGLGIASHDQPLADTEIRRLKALNLSHLRVPLDLTSPAYETILKQTATETKTLGLALELALTLSNQAATQLTALAEQIESLKPKIARILVFHKAEKSTSGQWISLAREYLSRYAPQAKIGGGTNAYFTELNRGRPPTAVMYVVAYSINPQVHAFDNASLVETLPTQVTTVESARQFINNLPLALGPITLKPRFNPNATGPAPAPAPGELPAQVDPRQMSLFGAGWTLGSLKYLAEAKVSSLTYYETTGWRGVMETEDGSGLPDQFPALPGSVFPLYHVLADVGEFDGGAVVPVRSSDPLRMTGLVLVKGKQLRVLVANLTPHEQKVTIRNLDDQVQVKHLDELNVQEAMQSPEEFRAQAAESWQTAEGVLEITLQPYALARIDNA